MNNPGRSHGWSQELLFTRDAWDLLCFCEVAEQEGVGIELKNVYRRGIYADCHLGSGQCKERLGQLRFGYGFHWTGKLRVDWAHCTYGQSSRAGAIVFLLIQFWPEHGLRSTLLPPLKDPTSGERTNSFLSAFSGTARHPHHAQSFIRSRAEFLPLPVIHPHD